ncbi:MAG: DUF4062 domain-containing protein [Desulfitobacteriia bacterium]|jgi:hypothetical protein
MEKRFQVFVSSTYQDLLEERNEVMQALLELNCMPAGMELFPAANDTQWDWIKRVIDQSDYYIVVIGGRYGTVSELTNQSYTEMEYRYAVESGKPVIGFLHENPSNLTLGRCETNPENIKKLDNFKKMVEKRLCKYWSSPADLGAKVSRSITQLIKQYPAIGWVRADLVPEKSNAEEILKFKRRIEELEEELDKIKTERPKGTEFLSSGSDLFTVKYYYRRRASRLGKNGQRVWYCVDEDSCDTFDISWDDIFSSIAFMLVKGVDSNAITKALNDMTYDYALQLLEEKYPEDKIDNIEMDMDVMRTILIQLRALKLINLDMKKNKWGLTAYGDNYMSSLMAVHK